MIRYKLNDLQRAKLKEYYRLGYSVSLLSLLWDITEGTVRKYLRGEPKARPYTKKITPKNFSSISEYKKHYEYLQRDQIKELFLRGKSIKWLARAFDMSEATVRKHIEGE